MGTGVEKTQVDVPYDVKLLIRLSKVTKGDLLQRRKKIHRDLLIATITKHYKLQEIIDAGEIPDQFFNLTKCKMDLDEVISIFDELHEEQILLHKSSLEYQLISELSIRELKDILNPIWDDFKEFILKRYQDFDPFLHPDAKRIFNSSLLKILTKFASTTNLTELQRDSLPFYDFDSLIQNEIKRTRLPQILKDKYVDIMCSYFESKSPILLEFIFKNYSWFLDLEVLKIEQDFPLAKKLTKIEFLLVDSNFFVHSLCTANKEHPIALAVLNQCKKRKTPLYYITKTKKEMRGLVRSAKREMDGVTGTRRYRVARNPFVQDFIHVQMDWADYYTNLSHWESIIQTKFGIKPLKSSFDIDPDKAIYHQVKSVLPILDSIRDEERQKKNPDYIPNLREDSQFEHDAYCLGLISAIKEDVLFEKETLLGPWFLTFDTLIAKLDAKSFREGDDFGLVIHPRKLLNYLLIYSRMEFDTEDQNEVAEAIIRFTTTAPQKTLSVEEYSKLFTYKIGLDEEDIEIVTKIFIESPLRDELEKALDSDDGFEVDDVAARVISNHKFVSQVTKSRETREKLRKAGRAYSKLIEALRVEREKTKSLEKIIEKKVIVEINLDVKIDATIKDEIRTLIKILDSEGAFQDGTITKPAEISSEEELLSWLRETKGIIEATKNVAQGVASIAPFIGYLITKITGIID